jgi:GMP synthase-like glutamine amidotransferase
MYCSIVTETTSYYDVFAILVRMRVLIVNNGQKTPNNFLRLFAAHECDVVSASLITEETRVDPYDLVVLTGSSRNPIPYSYELLRPLLTWISHLTVPTLGICYGSQLLATAFDTDYTLTDTGEKYRDFSEVSPLPNTTLPFSEQTYRVFEAHRWNITSLPSVFEPLIATSRGALMFLHHNRPMAGFQFHPEKYYDETDGVLLLNLCLARFGLPLVETPPKE